MKRTCLLLACCSLAAAIFAQPSAAQTSRFTFNVGGGFTNPVQDLENRLDRGWNLQVGGGVNVTPHFAIIGEFNNNETDISRSALQALNMPNGNARVWSLTVNPKVSFNPHGAVDFYLIGGGGWYHRTIEFTQPTVSTITVLDPWWGVIYPAAVPSNQILGSYTVNKPGANIGGGFTVRLSKTSNLKLYTEARYHRMFTNNIDTTFVPVTFGIRW